MEIVYLCKGGRGASCLESLVKDHYHPELIVVQPQPDKPWFQTVLSLAASHGIPVIQPDNPNAKDVEQTLQDLQPDLLVLVGYGKILKGNILSIPKRMAINLHGGKLPKYRGSSPLNWALINGDMSFTLSVIHVVPEIDAGGILIERTFDISPTDTIRDLHRIANSEFPQMLLETVRQIEAGTCVPVPQAEEDVSYYPLRFPDDGLILWDQFSAEQIHNRIRALTDPYPCAFTYFQGRRVKLLASELHDGDYFGEPGRVYKKSHRHGLLICAKDKCLWIKEATIADGSQPLHETIRRYECLATVRKAIMNSLPGLVHGLQEAT